MILYHTGYEIIKAPEIDYGRRNADFGQGFYLTAERDFAHRWARERKDRQTVLNVYELDPEGLDVHRFERNREWFEYIYANRNGRPDSIQTDLIIGPIANDTIYDTLGITTSGLLDAEDSMRLLLVGPEYWQIAVKTERAGAQLKWLSAEVLGADVLEKNRLVLEGEEEEYQREFARELERLS